jgi:hypothetical protein
MQPSPPCPTCGGPLRWFPEHNAWGCDRERKMLPAAAPPSMQPQAPGWGPPHGAVAPPHQRAPRAPRSPAQKKKLILIAAIGGAVVIGGVVAFLLLKGGDGVSGGASSPEELAKRAAAAINDSKVDDYIALSGLNGLSSIASCHFSDDNRIEMWREMSKATAKRNMGVKLEVKRVEPSEDKPRKNKAGKHLGDSCWLTRDMTEAKFDVIMKDGSDVEKTTMRAIEVDGHWFFSDFDDLPKGKDWEDGDDDKLMKTMEAAEEKIANKIRAAVGGSPESAAKGMIDAANWRSRSRARAIGFEEYGGDFKTVFDCDYTSELSRKLEHTNDLLRKWTRSGEDDDDDGDPDKDDEDRKPPPQKVGISVGSVKSTDKGKYGSGDDVDGCKIKDSAEWQKLEIEVKDDDDDKGETMDALAIKIDGQWRIAYLEGG